MGIHGGVPGFPHQIRLGRGRHRKDQGSDREQVFGFQLVRIRPAWNSFAISGLDDRPIVLLQEGSAPDAVLATSGLRTPPVAPNPAPNRGSQVSAIKTNLALRRGKRGWIDIVRARARTYTRP